MLTTEKPSLIWAWVCPITGIVLSDAWGATEVYAMEKTERIWGKRRAAQGDIRLCRVTVELVSSEETAAHRAEFAAWEAGKQQTC